MEHYNSFSEIDERLRILRLQRQIDSEGIKLHLNRAKTSIYPSNLLGGFSGMAKKILLSFIIKKLSSFSTRLKMTSLKRQISKYSE